MQDQLKKTYCAHRQGLYSLALSITGCGQQADDAIQAAFERLYRTSATPCGNNVSYVFAAVRNAAIDTMRSDRRIAETRETIFSEFDASQVEATSPTDELLTTERNLILQSAVDALEDAEREVVVLKTFAELTFDAIGEVLNQPAKTVATRYRRALIRLEEKLRDKL